MANRERKSEGMGGYEGTTPKQTSPGSMGQEQRRRQGQEKERRGEREQGGIGRESETGRSGSGIGSKRN